MSRSLLLRMLESFFRRWYLYLLPVLLLGAYGAKTVMSQQKVYQSLGTFNVESGTVLSQVNGNADANFGYDTPASYTSKRINAMLQTDQFVKDIVSKAQLDQALASGALTVATVRSSLGSYPNGSNLVNVAASNTDPSVAQKLADGTINAYVQGTIESQAIQSDAAVAYFKDLLASYQKNLDTAKQARDDFVAQHPASALGVRPDEEQAQLTKLEADVTAAQGQYDSTLQKSQAAELSTEQTRADASVRMRVIDQPQLPLAPTTSLKSAVMNAGTFVAIGMVLSIALVVVATTFDHSIRTANDVSQRLGVRALGLIPEADGRHGLFGRRKTQKAPSTAPSKATRSLEGPVKTGSKRAPARGAAQAKPAAARRAGRPVRAADGAKAAARGWPDGARKIASPTPLGDSSSRAGRVS